MDRMAIRLSLDTDGGRRAYATAGLAPPLAPPLACSDRCTNMSSLLDRCTTTPTYGSNQQRDTKSTSVGVGRVWSRLREFPRQQACDIPVRCLWSLKHTCVVEPEGPSG